MNSPTVGTMRRLQQCATPQGILATLAIDHRNNLQRALNPKAPDADPNEALVSLWAWALDASAPCSGEALSGASGVAVVWPL